MITAGVDLAGVNAMTMDYGGSMLPGRSMYENAVSAAEATHRQLTGLYRAAGSELGSETVWRKVGLTPMIGQNDVAGEIFTLKDAQELSAYASAQGIGRLSMWSLNRDRTCSQNFPDVTKVSDGCSGVDQGSSSFATILGAGVMASPSVCAGRRVCADAGPGRQRQPLHQPVSGVVREHRLHRRGSGSCGIRTCTRPNGGPAPTPRTIPSSRAPRPPGASSVRSWPLTGLRPQLTAPAGTAPAWQPATVYRKGDRVLFEGRVFEAKWWTQTDSPEAALQGSPDRRGPSCGTRN